MHLNQVNKMNQQADPKVLLRGLTAQTGGSIAQNGDPANLTRNREGKIVKYDNLEEVLECYSSGKYQRCLTYFARNAECLTCGRPYFQGMQAAQETGQFNGEIGCCVFLSVRQTWSGCF